MKKKSERADYDSPWKEIIEQFFEEFITFFFPDIHTDIDWVRGYEFLNQELQKIVRDSKTDRRRVDKLVRVWRKNGDEAWIAIHIEVQGWWETDFEQRMYQYHTLLYNHYQQEIVSLAILSDKNPKWKPDTFQYDLWGCNMQFNFPIVKLLDYKKKWDALEKSTNPFAVVIMAHLQGQATTSDSPQRLDDKFRLIRRLYEQGYDRRQILELFRFIDWIMHLSPTLAIDFETKIEEYEEERKMKYVTSIERRARREGLEEGHEKGLEEGIKKGLKASMQMSVMNVLTVRFSTIPAELQTRLEEISDISQLRKLLEWAVLEPSVDAFAGRAMGN